MPNKNLRERLIKEADNYKTQREAAKAFGTTEQYLHVLSRKNGILNWRQKGRKYVPLKTEVKICEECGDYFHKDALNNNPGKFCSKQCHGKWLGNKYGFKKKR